MKSLSVTQNFCLFCDLVDDCFTLKLQMLLRYCVFITGLLLLFSQGQCFLRYDNWPETSELCNESKMRAELVYFTCVKVFTEVFYFIKGTRSMSVLWKLTDESLQNKLAYWAFKWDSSLWLSWLWMFSVGTFCRTVFWDL